MRLTTRRFVPGRGRSLLVVTATAVAVGFGGLAGPPAVAGAAILGIVLNFILSIGDNKKAKAVQA